jgi:hypothetical protein
MQGKILAYKKSEYSKHTKEKSTHKINDKSMAGKNNFTVKKILFYIPQRDKTLSTSKKEVKNDGNN